LIRTLQRIGLTSHLIFDRDETQLQSGKVHADPPARRLTGRKL